MCLHVYYFFHYNLGVGTSVLLSGQIVQRGWLRVRIESSGKLGNTSCVSMLSTTFVTISKLRHRFRYPWADMDQKHSCLVASCLLV